MEESIKSIQKMFLKRFFGIEHRDIQPKLARAYPNTNCPERCIIEYVLKVHVTEVHIDYYM